MSAPRQARWLRIAATLVALAFCTAGLTNLYVLGKRSAGIDFYVAWAMAQNAGRTDLEEPYSQPDRNKIQSEMTYRVDVAGRPVRLDAAVRAVGALEATATPFLYTTLKPLSLGTYESDYRSYRLATLATLVIAIALLGFLFGYPAGSTIAVLGLFLWTFDPIHSDIRVANTNLLQLGQFATYLGLVRIAARPGKPHLYLHIAAGLMIALAIAFKPTFIFTPILVVTWWLFQGRFRAATAQLAGLILGGAAALTIGAWSYGSWSIWWRWMSRATEMATLPRASEEGNFSMALGAIERFGWDPSKLLLAAALGVVLTVLWRQRKRKFGESGIDDMWVACLGPCVFLIASPLVWIHYFVATIPLLMILLRPSALGGLKWLLPTLCLALLTMKSPVAIPTLAYIGTLLLPLHALYRFAKAPAQLTTPSAPAG